MSEVYSVTLVPDESLLSGLRTAEGALTVAQAIVVESLDDAELANGELRNVKVRLKWLKEKKSGFVEPARVIIANAEGLFDKAIDMNEQSERYLKAQLADFTEREKAKAREATRIANAEAVRKQQEAEAAAAKERAKAEEKAAEQRRLAAQAEQDRQAALAAGDAKTAAKLAGESASLNEKANATLENADLKASAMVNEAAAAVVAPIVAPKIAGFSAREHWVAELAHGISETQAVQMIAVAAAAGRPDLLAMLKLDMVAANGMAKALKNAMSVPGLQAVNRPIVSSRAA